MADKGILKAAGFKVFVLALAFLFGTGLFAAGSVGFAAVSPGIETAAAQETGGGEDEFGVAATWTVSITGWVYGEYDEDVNAPTTQDLDVGDGLLVYRWRIKANSLDDWTSWNTKPTQANTYSFQAAYYEGGSETGDFEGKTVDLVIQKADFDAYISIDDIDFGGALSPAAALAAVSRNDDRDPSEFTAFEYAARGAELGDDTGWSAEAPTDAGEYTVRAVFEATANYNELRVSADFEIRRIDQSDEAVISVRSWSFNGTSELYDAPPSVSELREDPQITWFYKLESGEEWILLNPTWPINAGDYEIKAEIAETTNYNGLTLYSDFAISKASWNLDGFSVTQDGWVYDGTSYAAPSFNHTSPEFWNNEGPSVSYEYSLLYEDLWSTEGPVNAGTYSVRATIGETSNFNRDEVYGTFTISKADFTASVTVSDWVYGSHTPEDGPFVDNNPGSGAVTYYYQRYPVELYPEETTELPTAAGEYDVRAAIAETQNYNSYEVSSVSFTIEKADLSAAVAIDGWVYLEYEAEKNAARISGNDGGGVVTFSYFFDRRESDDEPIDFSAWIIDTDELAIENFAAGKYLVNAFIEATENYNEHTTPAVPFFVEKAEQAGSLEISIEGWTYDGDTNASPSIIGGTIQESAVVTY
ncbi:MAG: MBG domain-containing protein, partial [Clostridiales bacterium]|nr:MBG domain-containing protein [Clostridiales bacterium]